MKANLIFSSLLCGIVGLISSTSHAANPIVDDIQTQGPVYLDTVPKRDLASNIHQFVVMIGGGPDYEHTSTFDLQNTWLLYSLLHNHYNVPRQNFYVAFTDGGTEGVDGFPNFDTNPDLDGDGIKDITHSSDKLGIEKLFAELAKKMTKEDHLFLCYYGGGKIDDTNSQSYLTLWDNSRLYPKELSDLLSQLNCNTITCLLAQNHAGGFIDDLKGENRFILTACAKDELSGLTEDLKYISFLKSWIDGVTFSSAINRFPADTGWPRDGFVSVYESFTYAKTHDYNSKFFTGNGTKIATPVITFDTKDKDLVREECLDRHIPHLDLVIRDNNSDTGVISINTPILRESPDIWIRNFQDDEWENEMPRFSESLETNYVYVNLQNRGKNDYIPSLERRYLHIYWTCATPANQYNLYTGKYTDANGKRYGGLIKSIFLSDVIEANSTYTAAVKWDQKKTDALAAEDGITIMAYVSDNPYGLDYDAYARKFEGLTPDAPAILPEKYTFMAEKKVLLPITEGGSKWEKNILLQNPYKNDRYFDLKFENLNGSRALEELNITVTLPDGLRPVLSNPRIVVDPENIYKINTENPTIANLPLTSKPDIIKINAAVNRSNYNGSTDFCIYLYDKESQRYVGTYSFYSCVSDGNFMSAFAINVFHYPGRFNNFLLTGHYNSDSGEPESVEWTTPDGEILSTSWNLNVNAVEHPDVILRSKYNGKVYEKTINLSNEYAIMDILRNGDNKYTIELNMPAQEGMYIRTTSASGNFTFEKFECTAGQINQEITLDRNQKGIIVVNLCESNGKIIVSKSIMDK